LRWPYDATLLTNSTGNDALYFESGITFTAPVASDYEIDLSTATTPESIASADVDSNGTADFNRYVAVLPLLDPAGITTIGKRLAIVVWWAEGSAYRKAVTFADKYDPSLNQATIPGL
jgi:hypothetical protein